MMRASHSRKWARATRWVLDMGRLGWTNRAGTAKPLAIAQAESLNPEALTAPMQAPLDGCGQSHLPVWDAPASVGGLAVRAPAREVGMSVAS